MPSSLPHVAANLSSLLATIRGLQGSGRIGRWRGQILSMVAKVWVMLNERWPVEGGDNVMDDSDGTGDVKELVVRIRTLAREIYASIALECPSVRDSEFRSLLDLSQPMFAPLLSASA